MIFSHYYIAMPNGLHKKRKKERKKESCTKVPTMDIDANETKKKGHAV